MTTPDRGSGVLLVTGASRGIGRAIALLTARRGWAVGVHYRVDLPAEASVVEQIAREGAPLRPFKATFLSKRRPSTSSSGLPEHSVRWGP